LRCAFFLCRGGFVSRRAYAQAQGRTAPARLVAQLLLGYKARVQAALGAWDRKYDSQRLDTGRLGDAFRKFQGRRIGDRRFISMGKDRTGKTEWKIETFKPLAA
jgi:hypothetical protein